MTGNQFDLRGLFQAIDAERQDRSLTWAELGSQVGVSTSTIRRFAGADDAEADGVLALVRWLGVPPENFVKSTAIGGEQLPDHGDRYVRVDMELMASAAGDTRGPHGRTRTTIQHLVGVAQLSDRTVGSLTRVSDV